MLPYAQLLEMLPKLRFKDDTFFRTKGLTRLSKAYDAYPVHESGRKLYCLLLKGVEIPNARKLTPATAVKQIIVLQEGQSGLDKLWPTADSGKEPVAAAPAPVAVAPKSAEKPEGKAPSGPLGSLEFVDE